MKICNVCGIEKPLTDFPTQIKRDKLVYIGNCRICHNIKQKEVYYKDHENRKQKLRDCHVKHRDVRNKNARIYYKENIDKIKEHYQNNREEILEKDWMRAIDRRYGITIEQYNEMLTKQNGGCAICKTFIPWSRSERFAIDHCHITGKVRGLLCHACNQALGMLNDDPEILRKAAKYIEDSIS